MWWIWNAIVSCRISLYTTNTIQLISQDFCIKHSNLRKTFTSESISNIIFHYSRSDLNFLQYIFLQISKEIHIWIEFGYISYNVFNNLLLRKLNGTENFKINHNLTIYIWQYILLEQSTADKPEITNTRFKKVALRYNLKALNICRCKTINLKLSIGLYFSNI